MTTITNMHPYSNLTFGKKKETQNPNNTSSPISEKVTKPIKTGLLVTSAFLAGLGTANVASTDNNRNDHEQIYQETISTNRPPSNARRDWYATREASANGENYIIKEHYIVKEIPFLVGSTVINKRTNNIDFKDTLYNYRVAPNVKRSYDNHGKLITSKEFYNFSDEYNAPERAQIKELLTDGSYDVTDIKYRIEKNCTNTKADQKEKEYKKIYKDTEEMIEKLFENW